MNMNYHDGHDTRKTIGKTWVYLRQAKGLGLVVFLALAFILINSLFSVDMTIKGRPLLNKILGIEQSTTAITRTAQSSDQNSLGKEEGTNQLDPTLADKVLPQSGVTLPAVWQDLGKQLVDSGVIDAQKFEALYAQRGGMTPEMKAMLTNTNSDKLTINYKNAQF